VEGGIDDAAARMARPSRAPEDPGATTPDRIEDLRDRLAEVRARLDDLTHEADGSTVAVPVELLERVRDGIGATRELLLRLADELEREEEGETQAAGATGEHDKAAIVALNMALNGAPRAETRRYLAENFDVPEAETIVQEAYARRERMQGGGATP
jgi:hypothetical protein